MSQRWRRFFGKWFVRVTGRSTGWTMWKDTGRRRTSGTTGVPRCRLSRTGLVRRPGVVISVRAVSQYAVACCCGRHVLGGAQWHCRRMQLRAMATVWCRVLCCMTLRSAAGAWDVVWRCGLRQARGQAWADKKRLVLVLQLCYGNPVKSCSEGFSLKLS